MMRCSYYAVYMSTEVLSVRVPEDVKRRLDSLSSGTGRTASFYIIKALEEYLEDLEDIYAADQAYREWETDGFATLTWEDAKAELGL